MQEARKAKWDPVMTELNSSVSPMLSRLKFGEDTIAVMKAAKTLALADKEQERLRAKTVQLDQIEDKEELQVSFNSVLFNRYR